MNKSMHPEPTRSNVQRPHDLLEKHDRDGSGHLDGNELVDMESHQSFPASDAPGWPAGSTKVP